MSEWTTRDDRDMECIDEGWNDALENFLSKVLQHATYTETEEGWSGFTVETKIIEKIYEELKR